MCIQQAPTHFKLPETLLLKQCLPWAGCSPSKRRNSWAGATLPRFSHLVLWQAAAVCGPCPSCSSCAADALAHQPRSPASPTLLQCHTRTGSPASSNPHPLVRTRVAFCKSKVATSLEVAVSTHRAICYLPGHDGRRAGVHPVRSCHHGQSLFLCARHFCDCATAHCLGLKSEQGERKTSQDRV